jgi:hypothetical protein
MPAGPEGYLRLVHRRLRPPSLLPFALVALALVGVGCRDFPVELYASGLPPEDVTLEMEDQGRLSDAELSELSRRADMDGTAALTEADCDGECRVLQLSIFVRNASSEPVAPPVVRLSAPAGRPERLPVAFRAKEISPDRTGRIRFLVALWPDEKKLTVTLSSSVFVEVNVAPADADPAP